MSYLVTPNKEDEDPMKILNVHLIRDSAHEIDNQPDEGGRGSHKKEDSDTAVQIQYLIKANEPSNEENETAEQRAELGKNYLTPTEEVDGK